MESDRVPPVVEGDVLDVQIISIAEKGDGVAKKDGFVIFVPGVVTDDSVRVKVVKVLSKFAMAEVVYEQEGESEGGGEDSESFGEDE